ncbi:SdpI family protein [Temperatibacter marinus]|uniref:SdpI family protein n=1 Tax=Temperatibacter marinus TaxID=1456591 RepID=A0AA52ECX1_9PROT|nr:SdpI family protein [Temperatibacter marinus]WND01393.1 SdpI family protein [Temperatibacter marinus]
MENLRWLIYLPHVISAAFAILGVPLALGLVAPNGLYGIRTHKTLENSEVWYLANTAGGIAMIVAGVVSVCIVILLHKYVGIDNVHKLALPMFVPVLMILLLLVPVSLHFA